MAKVLFVHFGGGTDLLAESMIDAMQLREMSEIIGGGEGVWAHIGQDTRVVIFMSIAGRQIAEETAWKRPGLKVFVLTATPPDGLAVVIDKDWIAKGVLNLENLGAYLAWL